MRRSLRSRRVDALFVIATNIISVWLWITTTRLEWFEVYFAQTVIEAWGDFLILLFVLVMRLLTLRKQMRPGVGYKLKAR